MSDAASTSAQRGTPCSPLVSVVAPVFNEDAVLPEFAKRVSDILRGLGIEDYEIVFIDDGSGPLTHARLREVCDADPKRRRYSALSRNFGHQVALMAGLHEARGQAVITMDSDLQHPPEIIPHFIAEWKKGAQVVVAVRRQVAHRSFIRRITANLFYATINWFSYIPIESGVTDFRLLDRKAVDAMTRFRERMPFLRGLVAWIGMKQARVPYEVAPRFAGTPRYSFKQYFHLASSGFMSFSMVPLRLAIYMGLPLLLGTFGYGIWILYQVLSGGEIEKGWTSQMFVSLLTLSLLLITMGIIGEFLGRVFEEVKNRPLFLVMERYPKDEAGASPQSAEPPRQEKN